MLYHMLAHPSGLVGFALDRIKSRSDVAVEDLEKTGSSGPRACEQCKFPLCTLCNLRPDKKEYRGGARVRKDDTEEPYPFVCMTLTMVVDRMKADGQYKNKKNN